MLSLDSIVAARMRQWANSDQALAGWICLRAFILVLMLAVSWLILVTILPPARHFAVG
jgi:hypothetical protein